MTDCIWSVMWTCGIGCVVLFCKRHADVSVERTAVGINVDGGVDGGHFGLEQAFVLFELSFVVGLNTAARLGVEILVEHVSVVVIPSTRADSDESEKKTGRNEARGALQSQPGARTQGVFRSAASKSDGNYAHHCANREPVSN